MLGTPGHQQSEAHRHSQCAVLSRNESTHSAAATQEHGGDTVLKRTGLEASAPKRIQKDRSHKFFGLLPGSPWSSGCSTPFPCAKLPQNGDRSTMMVRRRQCPEAVLATLQRPMPYKGYLGGGPPRGLLLGGPSHWGKSLSRDKLFCNSLRPETTLQKWACAVFFIDP